MTGARLADRPARRIDDGPADGTGRPGGVRPAVLAVVLAVGGLIGVGASFALTLDKLTLLERPGAHLLCAASRFISCAPGLVDPAGSLLGFPNSLLGLVAFPVVVAIAAAMLAGARFALWFWRALELAMLGALGAVVLLIERSVDVLGVLCPWCMLVWVAVIAMGTTLVVHGAATGHWPIPRGVRAAADVLAGWLPLLVLLECLAVAVVAQLRLDLLSAV